MTTVVAISDYKGILEMMSNGIPAPYFGIKGQEVSQAMADSGMPSGIYVISAVTDGPAYNAGIQPGDILSLIHILHDLLYFHKVGKDHLDVV